MNQIGRKIYYELATGNVIVETGERQGDVVETTEDQDFQMYSALQNYQQSAVGVIQLDYGQDYDNFTKYNIRVDITQNPPVIVFGSELGGLSLTDAQNQKILELDDMMNQTLAQGFSSSADGTNREYGYSQSDQNNMNKVATIFALNAIAEIPYASKDGTVINLTKSQFTQLVVDATNWHLQNTSKFRNLEAQVKQAQTVDQVNAIVWS